MSNDQERIAELERTSAFAIKSMSDANRELGTAEGRAIGWQLRAESAERRVLELEKALEELRGEP